MSQSIPSLALSRHSGFRGSLLLLFWLNTVVCVLLHPCSVPDLETSQDLGEFKLHIVWQFCAFLSGVVPLATGAGGIPASHCLY